MTQSVDTPVMAGMAPGAEHDAELAALMHQVAQADRLAFDSLYRATSPRLFAVVLRINRDRSQAEEVLQEVCIRVWRQASRFQVTQGCALAWLITIARNGAIDSLRRKAAQPATLSRFGASADADLQEFDLLSQLASDQPAPLELLEGASRAHSLQCCMAELSGDQRSSLALAYYQGLSHAEVATHMSQPLGTVKSWVRRGLQSLRGCLDRAAQRAGTVARAA